MTESQRSGVLREASQLIDGDRNAQYGPPTQDFRRTAAVLNSLGYARRVSDPGDSVIDIVSSDVAILVMAVKMSRLMHSRGKRDNWVDLAGYAGCGFECTLEEPEPEPFYADTEHPYGHTDDCCKVTPAEVAAEVIIDLTRELREAHEVIEELTKERDEAQDAVVYLDDKLTDTRKRFDATLQEVHQLREELQDRKTNASDANTITNLRDQLKAFAHHANDNVTLRAKVRELERELAEAKTTPTFTWPSIPPLRDGDTITLTLPDHGATGYKAMFSSYNGEPTDAGT